MIKAIKKILFPIILMATVVAAKSQTPEPLYYVGGFAGLNLNFHFSDFSKLGSIPNCCPQFKGGDGVGFALGGLFDLPLSKSMNLDFRLGISTLDGELNDYETRNNIRVVENQPPYRESVTTIEFEHVLKSKLYAFTLGAALDYNLIEALYGSVGLKSAYLFTARFSQYEQINKPNNVTFLDGRLIQNDFNDVQIPDNNSLQFFITFGLSYRLPIGNQSYLVPEFRFDYPITKICSVDWKASTLLFGVSFLLPVFEKAPHVFRIETRYERDTTTLTVMGLKNEKLQLVDKSETKKTEEFDNETVEITTIRERYKREIPQEARLAAKVKAEGINSNGVKQPIPTMVIEEMEMEEGFPLLPYIYFDFNSSDLSRTKMQLLKQSESMRFAEDSLPWNTMQIYSNLLNVVAYRMKLNPVAKLTVTGCNSAVDGEKDNSGLSRNRAEAVKSYLVDNWNIEPERILIKSQNLPDKPSNTESEDGKAENRRIELSSNVPTLLEPVQLKEIQRKSNPPVVEITPTVFAEAGLKNWTVAIEQDNRLLRRFNGSDALPVIRWNVEEEPMPEFESPVVITLSAEDVISQQSQANTQLTIKQLTIRKKRYELKDDKRYEKYSLILFDFDKSNLSEPQKAIIKQIKERVTPDSKVTISGYADRSGEQAYNKDLALRRCLEAQKILGINDNNLIINPVGSDVELYDNNTPEGRSYSRTVQIVIETPVKE